MPPKKLLSPSFWVVFFSLVFLATPLFSNQWIFFQNHLHSTDDHKYSRFPESTPSFESYSPQGIQALVQMAKKSGIGALAITDHNTIHHWFDPVFTEEKDVILLSAMEWTSMFAGHASLLGFKASDPSQAFVPRDPRGPLGERDYQSMIEGVHERGGLVVINHPKSLYLPHRWPSVPYDADGIELNFSSFMLPDSVMEWWQKNLRRGRRLFLLGGSDFHVGNSFGEPFQSTNLVWVKEPTPEALLEALREGRLQVLRSPTSAQIFLTMMTEKESFHVGDRVKLASPLQSVFLEIHIVAHKAKSLEGVTVHLFNRRGEVAQAQVTGQAFTWAGHFTPQRPKDFLWATVEKDSEIQTLLNPIYIESF